jgi:[ribosomal protein S18]-alanine N-acetyltransferase
LLLIDGEFAGYGILRGWEAGFDIPSLGVWIGSEFREQGLGRFLMEALHVMARDRGAPGIRLRVYPDNVRAIRVYRKLGYEFSSVEEGQLVGYLSL